MSELNQSEFVVEIVDLQPAPHVDSHVSESAAFVQCEAAAAVIQVSGE